MKSGAYSKKAKVYRKVNTPTNSLLERLGFTEVGWDFCNLTYLETVKDNAHEQAGSNHEIAFAIAVLKFRENALQHTNTTRYEIDGRYFEAVGQPMYINKQVWVNVKDRQDLNGLN